VRLANTVNKDKKFQVTVSKVHLCQKKDGVIPNVTNVSLDNTVVEQA